MSAEHATGGRHPITGGPSSAWEFEVDHFAWMQAGEGGRPDVVIQGPDGDVTIPGRLLPTLARGILAAHVDGGRTDRWPR